MFQDFVKIEMLLKWEQVKINFFELEKELNFDSKTSSLKDILHRLPLCSAIELPIKETFKYNVLHSLLAHQICGNNQIYFELVFGQSDGDGQNALPVNAPCGYIFKSQDPVYRCL